MLKKICFLCQVNLMIGERPNKKNIESLNLTQKSKSFKALTWKVYIYSFSKLPINFILF